MIEKNIGWTMAAVLLLGSQAWAKEHEGHQSDSPLTFMGALAQYDTNKDKKLSQEELASSGKDFAALDANQDGAVDAKEWRRVERHERQEDRENRMNQHHNHMNQNRSGAKPAPEKPISTDPM